jgi:hypothetical protein
LLADASAAVLQHLSRDLERGERAGQEPMPRPAARMRPVG